MALVSPSAALVRLACATGSAGRLQGTQPALCWPDNGAVPLRYKHHLLLPQTQSNCWPVRPFTAPCHLSTKVYAKLWNKLILHVKDTPRATCRSLPMNFPAPWQESQGQSSSQSDRLTGHHQLCTAKSRFVAPRGGCTTKLFIYWLNDVRMLLGFDANLMQLK